jgi:aspartate-semialdehyde dehydrogenase
MGFKVAVVGATGNVGREMLAILAERRFPADEVVALASRKSMGVEVSFGDKTLKCKALDHYDFSDVDICLMSAGGEVSKEWSPKIGAQGAVVIDNSSAWRMDPDVPLIVPEVNATAIEGFRKKNIIANPNCSTAQLVVALKPLHDRARIKRVVVATYQSVSGAGKEGMDELDRQTKAIYSLQEAETKKFPKRIAFNVIPTSTCSWRTATPRKSGRWWSRPRRFSIPRSSSPPPACACRCSSAIPRRSTSSSRIRSRSTRRARSCAARRLHRHRQARARRLRHALRVGGEDATYISRIRTDPTVDNGLVLWVVSDNLRKGAALNAIQIAEVLINRKLIKAKQKAA